MFFARLLSGMIGVCYMEFSKCGVQNEMLVSTFVVVLFIAIVVLREYTTRVNGVFN